MLDNLMSVVNDMTQPYTAAEAWAYDRFIAPAVLAMASGVARELAGEADADAKILDVGCGGGHLLAWLAGEAPRVQFSGVDLSPGQVARAQQRTARHGKRVNIQAGSALALPFDAGSFDAVISVASIKHWPDPMQGMREIYRVLRPGGVFHVSEVDRGCQLDDAVRFIDGWRLPGAAKKLALPLFRTFVAGQGIDLEDARRILRELGLPESGARRLPGMPGVLLTGTKPLAKKTRRAGKR